MTMLTARTIRSKRMKLKPISQEHAMGCGLACVAFVAGKSYKKILSLDQNSKRAWTRGYYCTELVELLSRVGLNYTWQELKRPTRLLEIPNGSIVFIKRSEKWPDGHFLVKVAKNKYMNPWINAPSIKIVRGGFQKEIDVITHVITPI